MATRINVLEKNKPNPFKNMRIARAYLAKNKNDNDSHVIVISVNNNFIIFKQNEEICWTASADYMNNTYELVGEMGVGDSFTYTVDF